VVFAPLLSLTVSVEGSPAGEELHLHAGGQGFWVGQLMRELGTGVTLVAPRGGETGTVLAALVDAACVRLHAVAIQASNGALLEDGRTSPRGKIATTPNPQLTRHDVDEMYGALVVEALETNVCVLAGPGVEPVLDPAVYQRLAADLAVNHTPTVADLSGEALPRALVGGVSVLKTSADDLRADGLLHTDDLADTLACARDFAARGADTAVVTRAEHGAVAVHGDEAWIVRAPPLEPAQPRGSGDAFTGGLASAVAAGRSLEDALRIGAAAGALNVTRRGLGSGSREQIERLANHVTIEPVRDG
jgi:1-phosphofructokinase